MKKLRSFAVAALVAIAASGAAYASEEGGGLLSANTKVSNIASLQRGARLYFNYCAGCHSIKYQSYSRLATDLKLSPDEVLSNFAFTGAKIGDQIVSNMPADHAGEWFGKVPPDLSLEARAKGPDWIYTYLKSFYLDPSRPVGWNNTVFPGASMPNVLWELQGTQVAHYAPAKPGEEPAVEKLELASKGRLSGEEFDETARDITTFLQYVGEPAALQREAVGVWVILYLAFFTFLAWLLNKEYWRDVH
ncbi:MAG: cytochrome c1 [Rudaea sp.]|uniref:cytochrome c1 n=1 Tax=unclassified Rudaea TaxID=2627037 RepID=UPI0010F730BB|nr:MULTISPECIES: cytochrome c1 [unclassified Rudaea]MBN8888269.1 cytochrome c1 [Rudaea sp.]MBR0344031.1 cytochrome c1 [Rudaea sp.]